MSEELKEEAMSGLRPEWPEHLPRCCPPNDAVAASGEVWYYVFVNPPVEDDFKSATEKGIFLDADPCERAGLSCYRTLSDLEALKATPHLRKKFGVAFPARAILDQSAGMLKHTPRPGNPGHHTLWLRRMHLSQATSLFEVAS